MPPTLNNHEADNGIKPPANGMRKSDSKMAAEISSIAGVLCPKIKSPQTPSPIPNIVTAK